MDINSLSVFFPCINEEGNLESLISKAEVVLKQLKIKYEIIIVNDGSKDKTGQIADDLAKHNPNIKVIHHPKNLGYGEALKSGFYNARFDTIVYTDGDRQFDFAEVTKFLEAIKNHDLVIGYRIKRKDPLFRILFKEGWKLSLYTFFGLTLKDVDCGFKMVRREVLQKITRLESNRGAMINAEIAIKTKKAGFKITQVGVTHYPRTSGQPTGANIKVIIKSYLDLLKLWWKLHDHKWSFILLVGIISLAAFFRFYKIDQYMTFLGDEGRDAIIIKKLLTEGDLPLIGPPTSVGNIYLGPLYYYMMAISMGIFWLNPVAAAGMNAFIGVLTVALIYFLGKVWFNRQAGLIAGYLYAISSVAITYSKSSWNPNPAPFFALIAIFSLYKLHRSGNFLWLILTGFSLGAALQMHYLAALLIPVVVILWIIEYFFRKINKLKSKLIFSGTVSGISSFLLVMLPLVIFDIKHNYLNYRAITELFSGGSAVGGNILANIVRVPSIFSDNLIGRYIGGENFYLLILVSLLVMFGLAYRIVTWPKIALGVWLIVGLFGLTFYQQSIYDHYLGFLNPVPFLLLGSSVIFFQNLGSKVKWVISGGLAILFVSLTIVNLQNSPIFKPPNKQLQRTQEVVRFVINYTGGKSFNFALLAQRNYDSAYQFYLDLYGYKPKQVPFDITDQLFVVCEDSVCDPTHSAKYEVAAFGWSKIEWEKDFWGVKIYKLVHNPSGKP